MKIAQVAPLYESVPPKLYGGTERVVSYLTETLVKLGHEVTLYASGDSETTAKLRPMCDIALRHDMKCMDPLADHIYMMERVLTESDRFDVVHFHNGYLAFPWMRRMKTPGIATLHGRLDIPDYYHLFREFAATPLVAISNSQKLPFSWANWLGTVYHGLPEDLYQYRSDHGNYLAFLGRISPEKGIKSAINIAKEAGMPLKIAAKVDEHDRHYFEKEIQPLLYNENIEFLGEISDAEKEDFLGNAYALIFPVDWPEPFGLVMIEAFACGTPVIAMLQGSVAEVIEHGTNGYIVKNIQGAVKAVKDIPNLSRKRCREIFEERFSATRMTQEYLKIYDDLLQKKNGTAVSV